VVFKTIFANLPLFNSILSNLHLNNRKRPSLCRPDLYNPQPYARQQRRPLLLAALHRAEGDAADVGHRVEAAAPDVRQHRLTDEQFRPTILHGVFLVQQDLAALGVREVV
jgi:hypothetical protein